MYNMTLSHVMLMLRISVYSNAKCDIKRSNCPHISYVTLSQCHTVKFAFTVTLVCVCLSQIFIDRDPALFEVILNFLRTRDVDIRYLEVL